MKGSRRGTAILVAVGLAIAVLLLGSSLGPVGASLAAIAEAPAEDVVVYRTHGPAETADVAASGRYRDRWGRAQMLSVEATLSMFAVDNGGITVVLSNPSRSLLLEPDSHGFREQTGWDGFGVQISVSHGGGLEAGQGGIAAELVFWALEAGPWVGAGSEFHLVMPPRRVGHGRVTRVLEWAGPG